MAFLERDANGRWFRIEVVGPGQRVKVTDTTSPTGNYWYEDPGKIGVKILPTDHEPRVKSAEPG